MEGELGDGLRWDEALDGGLAVGLDCGDHLWPHPGGSAMEPMRLPTSDSGLGVLASTNF